MPTSYLLSGATKPSSKFQVGPSTLLDDLRSWKDDMNEQMKYGNDYIDPTAKPPLHESMKGIADSLSGLFRKLGIKSSIFDSSKD